MKNLLLALLVAAGIALGIFAMQVIASVAVAYAEEHTQSNLYQVAKRGSTELFWYQDGEATCYLATNEAGASGLNYGVARGVALSCHWGKQ